MYGFMHWEEMAKGLSVPTYGWMIHTCHCQCLHKKSENERDRVRDKDRNRETIELKWEISNQRQRLVIITNY